MKTESCPQSFSSIGAIPMYWETGSTPASVISLRNAIAEGQLRRISAASCWSLAFLNVLIMK